MKLAIPTDGDKGIEDAVSKVFGRAKTFTIIEVSENIIREVKVLENPAVSYKHGAGPIVVKMLIDMGINTVMARELGPGASALLEQHNIKRVEVKAGVLVADAIENMLKKITENV